MATVAPERLLMGEAAVAMLRSRDFWAGLNPDLHIADRAYYETFQGISLTPEKSADFTAQLVHEGYFQEHVDWGLDLPRMAGAVRDLSARGLAPVFAFLYDEFWFIFHKMHDWYRALLGDDYRALPDFWMWNVDPARGEAGWRPHREKGRRSLLPNGGPISLSTWVPLSEATPLNGCMYLVPANLDPTYNTEREGLWHKEVQLPSVRALPGGPGDVFCWNQAVLHWGSRTSPRAIESRVSMAFEFQRGDAKPFNQPLLTPMTVFGFETRLKLIAKQIRQYRHMYRMTEIMAAFADAMLGTEAEPKLKPVGV